MRELHNQIIRCMSGACDETCMHFGYNELGQCCCTSGENGLIDRVTNYFKNIDKIRNDLQYYMNVNEELGVIYIPKFVIEKMIKEL